jgi:hypothetical protein
MVFSPQIIFSPQKMLRILYLISAFVVIGLLGDNGQVYAKWGIAGFKLIKSLQF